MKASYLPFVVFHFSLLLASCSSSGDTFQLKGKFKNFNQGELYIYSLDGRGRIDTVQLSDGRFTFQQDISDTLTLSVVFPNFSEIPVIAQPGVRVQMVGDASHLREVKVGGTDDNQLLTDFRLQTNELTPPEVVNEAAQFIAEHPASPASRYLLNHYFLAKGDADLKESARLLALMAKATPADHNLQDLLTAVTTLSTTRKGKRLPAFTAVTTEGRRVTNTTLQGELNVISVSALWNYESQNIQQQLQKLKKRHGQRLQVLAVSVDGNPAECRDRVKRDSLSFPVVCDGQMFQSPMLKQLAVYAVPELILVDRQGIIVDRCRSLADLNEHTSKRLGQ